MQSPKLKYRKASTIASLICIAFGVGEVIYGGYLFHVNRVKETHIVQQIQTESTKGLDKALWNLDKETQEKIHKIKGALEIPRIALTLDVYKANGTGTVIENNETNKEAIKQDNELMREGVIFVNGNRTDSGCDEILGHNMRKGDKLFTKLNTLTKGDEVIFTCLDDNGKLLKPKKYVVVESKEIASTNFSYGRAYKSTDYLALLTCNRKGTTRWLIMCKEKK